MAAKELVAVVDDDLQVRRALGRLLATAGFEVGLFGSGPELLSSPVAASASCIVLDLHLGVPDGFEVCAALRAAGIDVVVIFMTACDSSTTRARAATFARSAYLRKPFDSCAFLGLIRAAIEFGGPGVGTVGGAPAPIG